jgi:hypothetical protein
VKRPRHPRPPRRTATPLDDRARDGTEPWRKVADVQFCHWDRWLLRLALSEPEGLASITRSFRDRLRYGRADEDAEAMLAQIADLRERLARLRTTPAEVLDEVERASDWLHSKAFRRVWHGPPLRRTAAMRATPRAVLWERALRGNWASFPVSPARYAATLEAAVGDGWYDYQGAGLVHRQLELAMVGALTATTHDAERLAAHRALLAVAIDAMQRVDDSDGDLAELFREHEREYLTLLTALHTPVLLRDLLELVVWEDYGLFAGIDDFLAALVGPQADAAARELAEITSELEAAGLDHQTRQARRLHRVLAAGPNRTHAVERR